MTWTSIAMLREPARAEPADAAILRTRPAFRSSTRRRRSSARVQSGENVYFPDESHLNEAGEAVLADTLAAFLKSM